MFDQLNLEKTMYFHNNRPSLTYQLAFTQLANEIGKPSASPSELEEIIVNALKNTAIQLTLQKQPNREDYEVMIAFYIWVQNIHNDNLAPPQGARFPNNIVYDMLVELRKKSLLTPEETLLRYFLEGANARKISKGNMPNLEFIATTLQLDTIDAVKKLAGESSKAAHHFSEKFGSLRNYIEPQRKLEAKLTELKNDSLYQFLTTKNIFEFEREKNTTTGANCYLIEKAVNQGTVVLKEFDSALLDNAVGSMVKNIKDVYTAVLLDLQQAQKNSTEEAHNLAMWDASEWFARLYTGLSIAVNHNIQFKDVMNEFTQHPIVADILSRSHIGNFPANERNITLAQIEITELFTQDRLAKDAVTLQQSKNVHPNHHSWWNHQADTTKQDQTTQSRISAPSMFNG